MANTPTPQGPSPDSNAAGGSDADTSLAAKTREGGLHHTEPEEAVTREELARLLGLSTRTISSHAAKGHLVKWGDRYLPWASARALIAHQAESLAGRAGEGQEARARLTMAKAKTAELELARLEGRVVDAEETAQAWYGIALRVRKRILGAAKRIRMRLLHLTAHDVAVIEEELREALMELAAGRDTEETGHGV